MRVAALSRQRFEPRDVGLGDIGIDLLREQQGHIDVDPLADQCPDRREPRFGAGHLDHQVAAIDLVPQPACFLNRLVRVHGQIGRDLEADEAVASLRLLVNRIQRVGAFLDVAYREILEQRSGIKISRGFCSGNQRIVIVAVTDRLFEDRGVRGDAA